MKLTREQIRIYKKIEKTKEIIRQHEIMVDLGKEYLRKLEIKHAQIINEIKRVLEASK